MNVDAPLRVLADTVGVAIADFRRQFTPIVNHLINVIAAACHWTGGTGFV